MTNVGVIYKNSGHLTAAISFYDQALKINPNFEIANNNMAMAYTVLCLFPPPYPQTDARDPQLIVMLRLVASACSRT